MAGAGTAQARPRELVHGGRDITGRGVRLRHGDARAQEQGVDRGLAEVVDAGRPHLDANVIVQWPGSLVPLDETVQDEGAGRVDRNPVRDHLLGQRRVEVRGPDDPRDGRGTLALGVGRGREAVPLPDGLLERERGLGHALHRRPVHGVPAWGFESEAEFHASGPV
jgi:hypothetical protein